MPKPNVAALLQKITLALKPLKSRWFVFGAQAVVAAGASRSTADLDLTIESGDVKALLRALAKAGVHPRRDVDDLEAVMEELRVLPLEHRASGFQVDVVRAGPGLEELMLGRAVMRRIGRQRVPFIETNDLLVLKILAGREKDLEDVRSLLQLRLRDVDLEVVRARLSELQQLIDDSTLLPLFEHQVDATGQTRHARHPAPKR